MDIRMEQVAKAFGTTVALDGVDLEIDAGERIGLVGPNGSGKTTLIRTITGAIAREGQVRVAGTDPFDRRAEIAEEMAYVPQIAPEFDVRVGRLTETICRARGIEPDRVGEIVERLDLSVDRHADKSYRNLSGGMKQKLLIGLALAGTPDLLVMDEPTASLDAATRAVFFELCAELEGATVVLCSHRLEEIRHLVDTIVELEEGRVADVRSVGEFVSTSSRAIVECQFRPGAEPSEEELADLGFERVGDGVWSAVLSWEEKVSTVERLFDRYGEALHDVVVDDVTELEAGGDL